MKKLLSALLSVIMIVSLLALTSCGGGDGNQVETLNGKTPEEVYQASLETAKNLTSFSMTADQVITMTMGEEKMEMTQTVISKLDGHNSYSKIANSMGGSAETWYVDDVLYTVSGNQKIKVNIAWEDYVAEYMPEGATAENAIMNVPEDWFVDGMKFNKVDDGRYCLNFDVDSEKVIDYMSESFGSMFGAINAVGNFKYEMYFDENGNFSECNISAELEMEGVTATIVSSSKITDINSTTVTAPTDADSFVEAN